jgi:hypothetical protein
MGLESMRCDDHEVCNPVILPLSDQLVYGSMERPSSEAGSAGVWTSSHRDSVRKRRCAKYPELLGDFSGHTLRDHDVRPERKVWTVLLEGAHREDQAWILLEHLAHITPGHLVECI